MPICTVPFCPRHISIAERKGLLIVVDNLPWRAGVCCKLYKEPNMAKDARTGAGVIRAPSGLSGPSSKSSGMGKGGIKGPALNVPESAPHLNLSRFWKKDGSPFDGTRAAKPVPYLRPSDSLDEAIAPVQPLSWASANRPLTVGIVTSAIWLVVFAFYITRTLGWSELFLLLPPEFGGLIAVGLMPITFLWLLIAFIDRGRQLSQEGEALRFHLSRLTYPAEDAAGNVQAVTASLKQQADALNEASELVTSRLQALQAELVRNTDKLATVTGQLETGASTSAAAVTEQVDKLKEAIDGAAGVNHKIEDALRRQQEFIGSTSQKTLAQVNTMSQSLEGQVATLNTATERAKGLSAAIAQQVAHQEETLSMSNEVCEDSRRGYGQGGC